MEGTKCFHADYIEQLHRANALEEEVRRLREDAATKDGIIEGLRRQCESKRKDIWRLREGTRILENAVLELGVDYINREYRRMDHDKK